MVVNFVVSDKELHHAWTSIVAKFASDLNITKWTSMVNKFCCIRHKNYNLKFHESN